MWYTTVDVSNSDKDFELYLLEGDTTNPNGVVHVSSDLTKADVAKIENDPTLTFQAYAIQYEKFATASAAWTQINTPAGN